MTNQSTALVTGAGRGIGRAIALQLAERGHTLVLASRTTSQLEQTAKLCLDAGAAAAEVHQLDARDGAAIDALADTLIERHGAVDVLVNNAGVLTTEGSLDGDPDGWGAVFELNVLAPMRLTRRLAPAMVERERGTIVNLCSVAAIEGMTGPGVYSASKFALRGWSLHCYNKLREHGVKVVAIHPGYVATDMTDQFDGLDRTRMLTPDDIARAAMLAVDSSPACCPEEIVLKLTKSPMG